jgi:hypothetical protein
MQYAFSLGERIMAARQLTGIRRGTCGTIALVYCGVNNVYDVDFDGYGLLRLVSGAVLAPLRTPAERAKCATHAEPCHERTV